MYYIYALQSKKEKRFYISYTDDLKKRLALDNNRKVLAKKKRLPVKLVYYEACLNKQEKTHRERYLKTAWAKRYIKQRIKNYLTG